MDAVVAVKECSGDARRIAALIDAAPDLEILVGGDDWALEGFCAGATGWVTGVGRLRAGRVRRALRACRAGELERARAVYARLLPLAPARHDAEARAVLQGRAGPVGFAGGPVRPPRLALDAADTATSRPRCAALRAPVAA